MFTLNWKGKSSNDVEVNTLDYNSTVSELKLHSFYYIHFWTNILGKSTNLLVLQAVG